MKKIEYKVNVFTGIRPSGGLTIANVIGSVNTIVSLQREGKIQRPMVFVADLHAITDSKPSDTQRYVIDILKDYFALGLNKDNSDVFIQSHLVEEISELNLYFSRLISISELLRVPTLKEMIKKNVDTSNASLLLAMYPIMMSSDILLQKAEYVPVGEDQSAHIEMARFLAKKFNRENNEVFPMPKILSLGEPVRIMSLTGEGKMSKSNPSGAILLDDPIDVSLNKVKRAKTAFAGEMTESLKSLIKIGEFVSNEDEKIKISNILDKHMHGENVMGELKSIILIAIERYLINFQKSKANMSDSYVLDLVESGGEIAKKNARETIKEVRNAIGFKYV
ncbi:tryptophan--tRNA ligase [Patescibacteria group bacterium]|nr:tryptophan--tRNA ligase [Patescibacteria group bacterium]